jgi:uncharacterized protein YbbK (DUF523 family)
MSKPRIVVSRCLGYEACRYNGEIVNVGWLNELEKLADVITVCPEVLAGLGVPRVPINLYKKDGRTQVIQDETGLDVTEALSSASDDFLSSQGAIGGFILKSKSPSCGLGTTKIRDGDSFKLGSGVFAQKAMEKYGDSVFIDESGLAEEGVEAFLLRV